MKVLLFNRFITVSCLYISAMALLIGFTLSSFCVQATSEWAWKNMAWSMALASALALCLVLFLLFRAHAQNLAKVAQRSQELAAEIAAHKRVEEALAERTTRLEAVRDVAVEITRELDLTTLLGLITRRAEVGALLRATHTVMADLDLQGILTRIAEEASRIAGTSYVRVLLVDKAAQVLRVGVSTDGLLPLGLETP